MSTLNSRQLVRSIGLAIGLGVGLFGASPGAEGFSDPASTCGDLYYAWSPPTTETNTGVASAPVHDTSFNRRGNSYSYLAQGDTLFAIRNVADRQGAAGTIKWTWETPSGMTIPRSPKVVPLSRHSEFIFLTAEDGFLYKINADDGARGNLSSDTRRRIGGILVCSAAPGDQVVATPAVQLYESANLAFQDAAKAAGRRGDDLVFIITANGCGDTTRNRIIAYWASDLTVAWTINADFSLMVDKGWAECALDYATNTLFCGTDLAAAAPPGQRSLFAINTTNGVLKWATNDAGAILNRVTLHNGKLYVANKPGGVRAYDPAGNGLGGALPLWSSPLAVASPGTIISHDIWPINDKLLIVDSGGTLHQVQDLGTFGIVNWSITAESGVIFTTMPVAVASLNRAYVGRDDGTIQQIQLSDTQGTPQGVVVVNLGAIVFDPSLDIEGGAADFNRLVVAAGGVGGGPGRVTRLILPLCLAPPY
jgi:outer membrane protein assembly factor BamB